MTTAQLSRLASKNRAAIKVLALRALIRIETGVDAKIDSRLLVPLDAEQIAVRAAMGAIDEHYQRANEERTVSDDLVDDVLFEICGDDSAHDDLMRSIVSEITRLRMSL